ncbi:MAG TPA: ATP-binding protein [Frankiaceae bacterium]|nr:ATP-binding protein [Frankiaceae bacterium]
MPAPDEVHRLSALADAGRTSGLIFVASRAGQLAFSALMLASDRRRFSNPRSQVAFWTAVAVESSWLVRRIVARGRYEDRLGMWVDAVTTSAALVASQAGLSEGAAPWAKNMAIGAAMGASSSPRRREAGVVVATVCSAALLTGMRSRGRDAHVAGRALAVNDAVSWSGMSAASRVYVQAHYRYAEERDQADELAIERSVAAAGQAERSRQHEALHRVTIDMLGRIARTGDAAQARAIAAAEAARLRYALRAEGRLPQGLDEALEAASQEAGALGLRVELVTAELDATAEPAAVAAVRTSVSMALVAAHEFGAAARAVVRAHSAPGEVHIIVRDRGSGFDPESGGLYAARIAEAAAVVKPLGGWATVWSEPGSGVRLELHIPSVDGSSDEAADGVPHEGVGLGAAGDENTALVDHHLEVGGGGTLARAKDDVGITRGRDGRVGVVRDALKARPKERARGRDAHGRGGRHLMSLASRRFGRVGVSTQFPDLPAADTRRADGTLLSALLTWRASGLVTGAAALLAGAGRYRHRSVAVTQLAVAAGESAWFARRARGRDRWEDPLGSVVDAVTAVCVLGVGQWNLAPADRVTWLNWAPWSFGENVMCGQAMAAHPPALRAGAGGLVAAAQLLQGPRAGDRVANGVAHAAFFGVAAAFAGHIRSEAVRLAEARGAAVREGEVLGEERERAVQLRLLHDSAVQLLEAITSGRHHDHGALKERAAREAAALQEELARPRLGVRTLSDLVMAEIDDRGDSDLHVELSVEATPRLPWPAALAMAGACGEALTNVAKHAGVTRARVYVRTEGEHVVLEVQDDGVGFDMAATRRGFGTVHSIEQRMADAGGSAEIVSAAGAGTRVVTRWPA